MIRTTCLGFALALMASVATAQEAAMPADLTAWAGAWRASDEQEITITVDKKALDIEGFATWGASDPGRVERGGVNVGEITARVPRSWIEEDRLAFFIGDDGAEQLGMNDDEYSCIVEMELRDDVLVVGDNNMCGGMNVTFSGEYVRE